MNVKEYEPVIFNDIKCSTHESFGALLNSMEEKFNNNFDKNYSSKFIEEYSINVFNDNKYVPYFLPVNIFSFIIALPFISKIPTLNIFTCVLLFLLLVSSVGFHGLVFFKPIRKILNRHWLKNEENRNSIKKKIFMNNVVEKEFLKIFVNTYGKDALKKLLDENESVKYKNIISYMRNHNGIEENARKKEERSMRLNEIVNCITSDNT